MGESIRPYTHKLNPKAGQSPTFTFEFPDGFVLLIDTREQDALFLDHLPKDLMLSRVTLFVGDYSIKGFDRNVAVERKNVMDLFGSLGKERSRFKVELEKLSNLDRKWIVVEGSEEEVLSYQIYTKMHPNSVRQSIASIEIRYGIGIHYEPDRSKLERWILDRFIKFYKVKRGS